MSRITRNDIIEAAKAWAKRNGREYGHVDGGVEIKGTDARCAPYSYQFVEYKRGGRWQIIGASKARDIYNRLIGV